MLPAQRRQELQQLAVHRLAGLDQPLGGAFQVHRVPQHDSRRHQVEAAGPVALLLEAPIPDFPKAVEEGVVSENGIYGHSRFCNTDFDDKLACLNLSGV